MYKIGSLPFRVVKTICLICAVLMISFSPQPDTVTVYLVGDSTMADKPPASWPETGWGMPFKIFFDSSVNVDNRAKNGRSTRTFLSEGLWQPILDKLSPGDYVFIQFGHNDAAKDKPERYADPDQYRLNLERFVNETRSKRANPILLTPVSRRKFDKAGAAVETHPVYADLVRKLAIDLKVPLIDLDASSKALYQQFGEETSKLLFLQLPAGEHPNYPQGKTDNTHFNELGARKIAQLVLADLQAQHIELANHLVKPTATK